MADSRTCQKVCRHGVAPSVVNYECNSRGAWQMPDNIYKLYKLRKSFSDIQGTFGLQLKN